jgi:hypothetical protein
MKILLLSCLLFFVSCGEKNSSKSNNQEGTRTNNQQNYEAAGENFECNYETCDSAKEFCLLTTKDGIYATTECIPKNSEIRDCDAAQKQAKIRFSTTNNCSNFIACHKYRSIIKVTCFIP